LKLKPFKYTAAIIIFIIASVYVITFLAPVSFFQTIPLCPLKFWTGIPCPLCGMSRAFAGISHGEFLEAVRYHPLSPLFYAAGILTVVFLAFDGRGFESARTIIVRHSVKIALFLSALLIAVWVIRYNPFF